MSKSAIVFAIAAVCLFAGAAMAIVERVEGGKYDLVKIMVLNRHGHRAPNKAYWKRCPNDRPNLQHYDVGYEDLTGIGMKQEYDFGVWLRTRYHAFVGNNFDAQNHNFRAIGEPRIMQSAMALSQGIFPDGFGPGGFLPTRPQLVPVFSDLRAHEELLDDVPCWSRGLADSEKWAEENMQKFAAEPTNAAVLHELEQLCGATASRVPNTPESLAKFVKIVVDGVIFNSDFGLRPLGGRVSPTMMYHLRNISIQLLLGRLYWSDAQQTYVAMDFPNDLVSSMEKAVFAADHPLNVTFPPPNLEVFVCHRESMYGYAKFFGFEFNIPPLPPGEVPVSTSLVFELLRDRATGKYYVRTLIYTPYFGIFTAAYPGCKSPRLCTLEEMRAMVDTRLKRTGDWRKLCDFKGE